jgi:hypothetical protein
MILLILAGLPGIYYLCFAALSRRTDTSNMRLSSLVGFVLNSICPKHGQASRTQDKSKLSKNCLSPHDRRADHSTVTSAKQRYLFEKSPYCSRVTSLCATT